MSDTQLLSREFGWYFLTYPYMTQLEIEVFKVIEQETRKSWEIEALIAELQMYADQLYINEENNASDRNLNEVEDQYVPEVEHDNE